MCGCGWVGGWMDGGVWVRVGVTLDPSSPVLYKSHEL